MTAANDPERTGLPPPAGPAEPTPLPLLASAWRAGGLYYLAACLAALLIGLNPQAIYPTRREILPAPLPVLQCLAAVQALFFLLVHPLLMMWRADRRAETAEPGARPSSRHRRRAGAREHWAGPLVESATWLAATTPFYLAAAWLSDATATDVARSVLYAAALALLAFSAGTLMRTWRAARPAVLILLLLAAALPAVYYIAREFFGVLPAEWLWDLAPATFAWQTAESLSPGIIPHPLWALGAWPALAAALAAVALLRPRPRPETRAFP